ncbi:MAG TPA: STM3941 family protein [Paludibacter sp.]|nr:STM3941 family protein [Paludibacter sp.]
MKNTAEQIEISLSKTKLILMLIGSIVFDAAGLWFVINPATISNPFFGNPAVIFAIGIAAILFFGLCTVYIVRKLTDNKPGLIIDNKGLIDNSSGISSGQVLWSDIENILVVEVHRQKFILLQVENPQDYIDKQESNFKRKIMQMNFNMYGSPLSITTNALQIKFDELLNILNDHLNASRQ